MANPLVTAAKAVDRAFLKAATLALPRRQQTGYYLGDSRSGGVYVDTGVWGAGWRKNGSFDYAAAVGDGQNNSIVTACLGAIASAMPEPPLRLYEPDAEGEMQVVPKHDLVTLLRRPNPFMSCEALMVYVACAHHLYGAAYLWKARNAQNKLVELWPIAPSHIAPAEGATTKDWISHFVYRPDSTKEAQHLPIEDVVYLPFGLDPNNVRRPRSPLASVMREIFTDEESAQFLANLLRNYGVPPLIFTPEPSAANTNAPPITPEMLDKMKVQLAQKFGGDNRGEVMVSGVPMKVTKAGYSPTDLNLDKLRLLPESRVCAVLGVPAIVANLYLGNLHSTYNNTSGLREHFTESKMIPYWRQVQAGLTFGLVPEFFDATGDSGHAIRFDLREVRALQEDQDAKYRRLSDALSKGGILLEDFRRELGFPELEGDAGKVFYVPTNVTPTAPEELLAKPEPVPIPLLGAPGQGPRALVAEVPADEEEEAAA